MPKYELVLVLTSFEIGVWTLFPLIFDCCNDLLTAVAS